MRFKYIILLVVFIISIVYLSFNSMKSEVPSNSGLCNDISSDRLKMVCYAMLLKNYSYCKLSLDFTPYCYDTVFPLLDVSREMCNKLEDEDARLSCYTNLAVKERNATICEYLKGPNLADICYIRIFDYVDQIDNIELCQNIPHQSTKFACMASITGEIGYCDNITIEIFEKGYCLATITHDVNDCFTGQELGGALSRVTFSSCIRNVAINTGNITMCEMVGILEDKWKCRMALSDSQDICEDVPSPYDDLCKLEYIKNNI